MGNRFRLWCGLAASVASIVAVLAAIVAIAAVQEQWARIEALAPAVVATLLWILAAWYGIKDGGALSPSTRARRLTPRQNMSALTAAIASAAGVAVVVSPTPHGRPEITAGCEMLGLVAGLVALGFTLVIRTDMAAAAHLRSSPLPPSLRQRGSNRAGAPVSPAPVSPSPISPAPVSPATGLPPSVTRPTSEKSEYDWEARLAEIAPPRQPDESRAPLGLELPPLNVDEPSWSSFDAAGSTRSAQEVEDKSWSSWSTDEREQSNMEAVGTSSQDTSWPPSDSDDSWRSSLDSDDSWRSTLDSDDSWRSSLGTDDSWRSSLGTDETSTVGADAGSSATFASSTLDTDDSSWSSSWSTGDSGGSSYDFDDAPAATEPTFGGDEQSLSPLPSLDEPVAVEPGRHEAPKKRAPRKKAAPESESVAPAKATAAKATPSKATAAKAAPARGARSTATTDAAVADVADAAPGDAPAGPGRHEAPKKRTTRKKATPPAE